MPPKKVSKELEISDMDDLDFEDTGYKPKKFFHLLKIF